ncbi:hypothetical protein TNCV_4368061 [Trichonephila clavipes]|nr:hypothetical protein TNCV_4368061 [Trichonephila clavipes]
MGVHYLPKLQRPGCLLHKLLPYAYSALQTTRVRLVMDLVILKHGQVTGTTPELAPPSPNCHTNGKLFQLSTDLTCIAALHGGSLVAVGSNSRHANHDWIP